MYKLIIGLGFALMIGLQLWVPSNMIYENTRVISEGTPYKFKTRPIDPNDPFRGKYVALNFEMDEFYTEDTLIFGDQKTYGQKLYVYLETDSLGYAQASSVSLTPKDTQQDYVIATAEGYYYNKIYFELPFNRFYMEEGKALEAEIAVADAMNLLGEQEAVPDVCYALVYIDKDRATLDEVFINDVPLRQVVLNNREAEQ